MKVLITNYDMEVGGVERSLAAMLSNFDYDEYQVDLQLHSHTGPLLNLIDSRVNILQENSSCKTFRLGIKETFFSGHFLLAMQRLKARISSYFFSMTNNIQDSSYFQYQRIWDGSYHLTESIDKQYDVAISYLWPHHYTAFNVNANVKIAWIHTDYSVINVDIEQDFSVWNKFDFIISISDACTEAFLKLHPSLKNKIHVVENLNNPDYVRLMSLKSSQQQFESGFNLVSVGRLCDAKAFDRSVEVLSELNSRGYDDIYWYVIGEGGDRPLIESKIRQYNMQSRFVLLGSTTNPYPYMNSADIYLQPSRYEGKAVTVGEALILAKPVIITNYPTAPSQIDDGVNGIICDQSVSSIADAIEMMYLDKDLRDKLTSYNMSCDYNNADELIKLYRLFNSER